MVCSIPRENHRKAPGGADGQAEMEPRGAACGFSARLGWPLVLLVIAPVCLAASRISQLPVPDGSSGGGHSPIPPVQAPTLGKAKGGIPPYVRVLQLYFPASEHQKYQSFELVALLYYGAPKLNTSSTQMSWFGGVFGSLGCGGVVHSACLWEASRVILTCCQHFPKQKLGGGDQFSAFPLKLSR